MVNIKWTNSAVNDLVYILVDLEDNNQHYYARKIEKRVLSKIKTLAGTVNGFYSYDVDICRITYRITEEGLRILKISLVRPIIPSK